MTGSLQNDNPSVSGGPASRRHAGAVTGSIESQKQRRNGSIGRGWRTASLAALACLAGCASYHAAPLTLRAQQAHALAALDRTLPDGRTITIAPTLSPGSIAALAVLNDPTLAADRATVGIATARQFAAGLLPDPQVTGGFAALLGGPGSAPSITGAITQNIAALITRGPQLAAARAKTAEAEAHFEWQEWQVAAKTETLAVALWSDQRRLAALNHARTALARLVASAKSAVQQGNLAIGAASAAEASLAGIDANRDTIAQQAQTDHAQLAKRLGLAPDVPIPVGAPHEAPLPAARVRALVASIARRRPDLIALRYGYSAADADLRAQIRAQFPLVSLAVNGGSDTTRVASAGPSITLDLPIFNDNRGHIAVARATRRQLAAAFRAALDGAANDATAAEQALALLRREQRRAESRLDSAQRQARDARRAYAQGLIDARVETNLLDQAVTRETQMIVLRQKLGTGLISLRTLLGAGLPTAPAAAATSRSATSRAATS